MKKHPLPSDANGGKRQRAKRITQQFYDEMLAAYRAVGDNHQRVSVICGCARLTCRTAWNDGFLDRSPNFTPIKQRLAEEQETNKQALLALRRKAEERALEITQKAEEILAEAQQQEARIIKRATDAAEESLGVIGRLKEALAALAQAAANAIENMAQAPEINVEQAIGVLSEYTKMLERTVKVNGMVMEQSRLHRGAPMHIGATVVVSSEEALARMREEVARAEEQARREREALEKAREPRVEMDE